MSAIIDYLTSWNSSDSVASFGYPSPHAAPNGTPNFGQSFQTPDSLNTLLQTFVFEVSLAATVVFVPYLYEWTDNGTDTGNIVGSPLFTGSPISTSGVTYQQVVITVGVNLNPAKKYVMFLSTDGQAGSGNGSFAANFSNPYPWFTFNNNAHNSGQPWNIGYIANFPLAFKATFDTGSLTPTKSYLYQTP